MTINNFKTIAEIINHTLFFNFINKKDEDLTYNYIFTELLEFYCGQNPFALAEPENLIPLSRRRLIKHITKSKESGLRLTKRRINLKKRLRTKIRQLLSAPYKYALSDEDENKTTENKNIKLISKKLEKRNNKINKLQTNPINPPDDFSVFNDLISDSFMSIDSLGPHTLSYLGEAKRVIRTEENYIKSSEGQIFLEEIKRVRDKFRYIIEELDKDFHDNSDKDISFQERKIAWEAFLKDNKHDLPLFLDLKRLLQNLNDISQRDSQLHTQVKVCKYKKECERPYFYASDKAQVICGSKKCRKRSRKSK